MKLALVFCLLFVSNFVHAQSEVKFPEQKAKVLEYISAKMKALETTKKCVEAATSVDGIKKCHEQAKEERKKLDSQRIEDQIKKLEDKKKHLEEKKS